MYYITKLPMTLVYCVKVATMWIPVNKFNIRNSETFKKFLNPTEIFIF